MPAKSIIRDINHDQRRHNKQQRLDGLQALREEWIMAGYNDTDMYVSELNHKIKVTENQLKNMRP